MVSEPLPSDRTPVEKEAGRRWLTVLLFASLIANVFFAGLVGGRLVHLNDWFEGQPAYFQQIGPVAGHAIARLLAPLDRADRQIVQDVVRGRAGELQQINKSIREQRKLVAQLLRADQFDRKAVDDAFAELRRRNDSLQSTLQSVVGDAVEKLPPAARKQLED